MKIVILSSAGSIHVVKWANGLVQRGVDVHIVSCHELDHDLDPRVVYHLLPIKAPFGYVLSVFSLRRLLDKLQPDLVNVHYATGYGLLGRLCRFKPLLLSVWGSDVYEFPGKSKFHKCLLGGNLRSATGIASTSHAMAETTSKIFRHKSIFITPFGINESVFCPAPDNKSCDELVIGTVKTLDKKYGVDVLIEAFAIIIKQLGSTMSLRLEITGSGPDAAKLVELVGRLGLSDKVVFHGAVKPESVPEMLNDLDIYVALSRFESFGVAILEASSCEKPVVVSDADGPAEVTVDGITGYVVPKDNPKVAAEKLIELINDAGLRRRMGRAGRKHVLENYTWETSLCSMMDVYKKLIGKDRV
jgi:L-malate glycosyltransferase